MRSKDEIMRPIYAAVERDLKTANGRVPNFLPLGGFAQLVEVLIDIRDLEKERVKLLDEQMEILRKESDRNDETHKQVVRQVEYIVGPDKNVDPDKVKEYLVSHGNFMKCERCGGLGGDPATDETCSLCNGRGITMRDSTIAWGLPPEAQPGEGLICSGCGRQIVAEKEGQTMCDNCQYELDLGNEPCLGDCDPDCGNGDCPAHDNSIGDENE